MTPFFTRFKFAFKTFFAILFRDRVPEDVAAVLMTRSATAVAAAETPAPVVKTTPRREEEPTATQMLAVLQRDGRLIDFLMEDISAYGDAQIGAAVRSVHAGCRQALQQYVSLAPALDVQEGARVTIDHGNDTARVKLLSNVSGQPPFTGVLHHRGWVASRVELPPLAATGRQVIAPAEIEVT